MRNPMVKWCAVLVAACLLLAGCSGGGLPQKIPESGLIVDVTQFAGMSRAEIEKIAGEPESELPYALWDPATKEVAFGEPIRGLVLGYRGQDGIVYSFSMDTVEDIAVGMLCADHAKMIPFDGESFAQLLERFGIKMSENARITQVDEERWNINEASDNVYNVRLIGYDEEKGGFASFEVSYYEEYSIFAD